MDRTQRRNNTWGTLGPGQASMLRAAKVDHVTCHKECGCDRKHTYGFQTLQCVLSVLTTLPWLPFIYSHLGAKTHPGDNFFFFCLPSGHHCLFNSNSHCCHVACALIRTRCKLAAYSYMGSLWPRLWLRAGGWKQGLPSTHRVSLLSVAICTI